jgi:glycosyltransferase involved in cell wall biosynthesis
MLPCQATANTRIDVIIPTWNEEAWLPRLLQSLGGASAVDTVIVADNRSDDNTRAIAKSFGCRLVQGGQPAKGRNVGATVASAEILLFVDADTILPSGYFDRLGQLFHDESTIGLHFRSLPLSNQPLTKFLYGIMDGYIRFVGAFGIAQGVGSSIAVRASAFRKLGGFPEDVAVGEDAYFLRDLGRVGKVRYVRDLPVYTSSRRLRLEGRLRYIGKLLVWLALRLIHSKASVFKYRWERYPQALARVEDDILACGFAP